MRSRRGAVAFGKIAPIVAVAVVLSIAAPATGAPPPQLPTAVYIGFLANLSLPVTAPGSSVSFSGTLHDPLPDALVSANLTFEFYAYNGFPGNATGSIPAGQSPEFTGSGGSGTGISFLLGTVAAGTTTSVSSNVVVPSAAQAGDYALRSRLTFFANGSSYLLESRGYFSATAWTNATRLAGNVSTLNLTQLGVSGVLPESALPVRVTSIPIVLVVLGVAAVGLAALGGYYAVRRGPGSRSGASSPAPPKSAPSAFGNKRKSDGD